MIRNEFIKNCSKDVIEVITNLFNLILDSGVIPTNWCLGIIIPLYKNKGSVNDPDNYRGITLLSCLSKLFTSALNNRITIFLERFDSIGEEQAGFRAGYSTMDHVFVLNSIIDIYLQKRKRVYCAFIDYKKAFDLVDRSSLWSKLISHGINGKLMSVIFNLYHHAKSCVRANGKMSDYFTCNVGVRQGENLSPLLFAIYLNDFESYVSRHYKGLDTLSDDITCHLSDPDIEVFLRLHVLLYADDTIVMAETPEQFQKALNAVSDYCSQWNLTVNTSKTKIVIFSRGKVRRYPDFVFGSDKLDVVDEYVYLGVKFNYNGKYKKMIQKQITQARKALCCMLAKARKLQLPIDIQCQLFDNLVLPVLLYGSEVWGYEDLLQIEVFHRKFLRLILHVNRCTPDCMIYGETGRGAILNVVKCRMVSFWSRLVSGKQSKYSYILYNLIKSMHVDSNTQYTSKWINMIEDTLNRTGLGDIWLLDGSLHNTECIKDRLQLRLNDILKQEWLVSTYTNRVCTNYTIFKETLEFEEYLITLDFKYMKNLCKFRCRSHNLPVNNGRFIEVTQADLKCTLCKNGDVGDEYHYLCVCSYFNAERTKFIGNGMIINSLTRINIY